MKKFIKGTAAVLGLVAMSVASLAQAEALVIDNSSAISFSGYNGQPAAITGSRDTGFWGSIFATTSGHFTATYLGQESGYVNNFVLNINNVLLEADAIGTSITSWVAGPGTVNFSFSDDAGGGHTFSNGQAQGNPLGFAILDGHTTSHGTFDYILGFNDSYQPDADYDDFVVGINFVSAVPEPETYAMMLAGLGLLGFTARRRKANPFA